MKAPTGLIEQGMMNYLGSVKIPAPS